MTNEARSSSDLYFVSFVYAKDLRPVNIKRDGQRKIFYFDDPRFDQLSEEYYARNSLIEPIAFQNAIRNVKALIYNH